MNVQNYLTDQGVEFTVGHHEERFTALEEAEAQHISGGVFAKTVIVKVDGKCAMLVLPASRRVDLASVTALLGGDAMLAQESEVRPLFPDCDLGAEPPFGSQYGLATYVDESLSRQDRIAIRTGNHTDLVMLTYADYDRVEHPRLARFSDTTC